MKARPSKELPLDVRLLLCGICVFVIEMCPGMSSEVSPDDVKEVLSDLSVLMRITNPLIHFLGQLLYTFSNWNCYMLS